jgi:hypothetical protein
LVFAELVFAADEVVVLAADLGVVAALAAGFLAGALAGVSLAVSLLEAFSGRKEVLQVASMSSSWSRSLLTCSLA